MVTSAFVTPEGVRVPAVTTAQMREIDRVAIEGVGPGLLQMMEHAGRELASSAIEMLGPRWTEALIVVLAGSGGNGGGGICAARHLANRGGSVTLVLADPRRLSPAAAVQLGIFGLTPGTAAEADSIADLEADLVIDALIGYGIRDAPRGPVLGLLQWAIDGRAPVLSLDLPSGLDATTGRAPGKHVTANRTLTLGLPKTGLGVPAVGELWLADIGIPAGVYRQAGVADVPESLFVPGFRVSLAPVV